MELLDDQQINSRIQELNILLERYKFDRNVIINTYQSTLKQNEYDNLKLQNEQNNLRETLKKLKNEPELPVSETTNSTSSEQTFRRDMLWQTKLSMLTEPSCYNNDVVEQFNIYHSENTSAKSQVNYIGKKAIPIADKQIPEARKYFNTLIITAFIPSSDSEFCDKQIECIQRHIDNSSYEHVVIFYQDNTNHKCHEHLNRLNRGDRFTLISQPSEPKVVDAIQLCKEQVMDDNSTDNIYILASPLFYADMSINILKKFDLTGKCLAIGSDKYIYWEMGYIAIDSTVLNKKFSKKIKFLDYTGIEQVLYDLKQQNVECLNLTPTDYLKVYNDISNITSLAVHDELQLNKPDMRNRKSLTTEQTTFKNFVNGDCCEWKPGMIYYEDRLSGEPGKFFETKAGRLFYTATRKLCVFYLCCEQEITSGALYRSINKFVNLPSTQHHSFDLHICVDKCTSPENVKLQIDNILKRSGICYINNIFINIIPIPDKNNIFTYDVKTLINTGYIPPMGASHGVNQLFYDGLKKMCTYSYENFLMLETDCQPTADCWFDQCFDYCENTTQFTIAGSKHKGASDMHRNTEYADHLNGVAIYKNCPQLLDILDGGQKYIEEYIRKNQTNPIINFDVANYMWAKKTDIINYLVDVPFISNYSSKENKELTVKQVLKRHPETVILHKKFGKLE